MTLRHPYVGLPDRQFWKNDAGIADPDLFDPVSVVPFKIAHTDKIVTAGSCFAQHLARVLSESGFNHFITEPAHPIFSDDLAKEFNYGTFSARYGNVYTARQFLQLLHRAFGLFEPVATAWPKGDQGRVVDPFRPQIQPDGFVSDQELSADRAQHFAAIRRAVAEMDVLVFTLGLTECWQDTRDGAIFPLAPGVAGGVYDPALCRFVNFDADETAGDLRAAFDFIRARNPNLRIMVTVSPVPLNATFENRHVVVSTALSKAVLRVAAEKVTRAIENCVYFPSYEVITAPQIRGRYFGPDCRDVRLEGVAHVMRLFFRHFGDIDMGEPAGSETAPMIDSHSAAMEQKLAMLCDEEAINNR